MRHYQLVITIDFDLDEADMAFDQLASPRTEREAALVEDLRLLIEEQLRDRAMKNWNLAVSAKETS